MRVRILATVFICLIVLMAVAAPFAAYADTVDEAIYGSLLENGFPRSSACGLLATFAPYGFSAGYNADGRYGAFGLPVDGYIAYCADCSLDCADLENQFNYFLTSLAATSSSLTGDSLVADLMRTEDTSQGAYNAAASVFIDYYGYDDDEAYSAAEAAVSTYWVNYVQDAPADFVPGSISSDVIREPTSGEATGVRDIFHNALLFLDSVGAYFSWLPDSFSSDITAQFALMATVAGLLVVLKIMHG